jgi:hypothetical protein
MISIGVGAGSAEASTVSLLPKPAVIPLVGNSTNVSISVDSMRSVQGVLLGVLFDPGIVQQVGAVSLGELLPPFDGGSMGCLPPIISKDNSNGRLCISVGCVDLMGISGSGNLVVIPFQGSRVGSSALTFSASACPTSPPGGCRFESTVFGSSFCDTAHNGSIEVTLPGPTSTPTNTVTKTPTASYTVTPSLTYSATLTPTRTLTPLTPGPMLTGTPSLTPPCVGDCNSNDEVTVDELTTMVNILLELPGFSVADCTAGDANGDGSIAVDEITTAVNYALESSGFICAPVRPLVRHAA